MNAAALSTMIDLSLAHGGDRAAARRVTAKYKADLLADMRTAPDVYAAAVDTAAARVNEPTAAVYRAIWAILARVLTAPTPAEADRLNHEQHPITAPRLPDGRAWAAILLDTYIARGGQWVSDTDRAVIGDLLRDELGQGDR